jgi:hypothetical protein
VLFAQHGTEAVHVNNQKPSGERPFIEISAANVYGVGPNPVVHVDTGAALSLLGGVGFRSVYVDVSVREGSDTALWRDPPDATATNDWSWNAVVPGQAAPAGDITIAPSHPSMRRHELRSGGLDRRARSRNSRSGVSCHGCSNPSTPAESAARIQPATRLANAATWMAAARWLAARPELASCTR